MDTIKNVIVHFTDGSTFECKTFERGTWKSSCDGIWVDNTKISKVEHEPITVKLWKLEVHDGKKAYKEV